MRGWAIASLFGACLSAAPVWAAKTCDTILPQVQYCTDLDRSDGPISKVVFPDLVKLYYIQREPLITSLVVAMPVTDTTLTSRGMLQSALDQMMRKGTARFARVSDVSYGERQIADKLAMQAEFLGRHASGDVMAAVVVEALQFEDHLLIVYTVNERADTVTADLREHHITSLRNLRFDGL